MNKADEPVTNAVTTAAIENLKESSRQHADIASAYSQAAPDAQMPMKRLSVLADTLAARLDALGDAESRSLREGLAQVDSRIETLSQSINKNLEEHAAILVEGSKVFAEGVQTLSSQTDLTRLGQLGVQLRETGDMFLRRLEEFRERHAGELGNIVKQALADSFGEPGQSLNPQELGGKASQTINERLSGISDGSLQEISDNLREINTILADLTQMAGLEDRLPDIVGDKIQSLVLEPANTTLEALQRQEERLAELKQKISEINFADIEGVSSRIAGEVGKHVESQVVVPVANALVRQAPEILSRVQNDQLSEVVLKSVRDAQRPLLREVVNGRRGVPLWLFASLLLPLLLILGYLFADVLGIGGGEMQSERISDTITRELSRLSATGVPLTSEDNARLRTIEGLMVNSENLMNTMYENAWAQVKSNGTLEAEVRNLRRSLEERDKLISEYNTSLQQQSKRIRAYEIQLTRLGISPDTVPDSE
jgi:hypothetical protein